MARPKKISEQATAFAIRQVYRNLLRSIPPSVRFSRPAASNVRRLIRDDFSPSIDEQGTVNPVVSKQELHLKAQNTIALLLSSSYSPRLKSSSSTTTSQSSSKSIFKSQQLSHKLISNLSSLTYHHLSPNTRMQPMSRTTGGSNLNTNLPSSKKGGKTSKKRLAFLASQREDLEEEGEGNGIQDVRLEDYPSRPLPSLFFPSKPIRGPMTSPSSPNWDGQNPYKHSKNLSSQDVQALEEKVGELAEILKSLKSEGKEDSNLGKSIRKEFVEVRGTLKSKRGQILREREISERNGKPIKLLDDLVKAVEETEKVWIGKKRWGKLKRNDWLEP